LGPLPNPQSPIPNPQSPLWENIYITLYILKNKLNYYIFQNKFKLKILIYSIHHNKNVIGFKKNNIYNKLLWKQKNPNINKIKIFSHFRDP